MHPLDIRDRGPGEVLFESGSGFGDGDETPDEDQYNAVPFAGIVTMPVYLLTMV